MKKLYAIAVECRDKETNADVTMYVKDGATADSWFTTLNIGEAFLFWDKNVAHDVASDLTEYFKEEDSLIVEGIMILSVKIELERVEYIES